MLLWQRLLVRKVPTMERCELLAPLLPPDQLYPEPLAEFFETFAWQLFLLVFLLIVFVVDTPTMNGEILFA